MMFLNDGLKFLLCYLLVFSSSSSFAVDLDFINLDIYGDSATQKLIESEERIGLSGRSGAAGKFGSVVLVGNLPNVYLGKKTVNSVSLVKIRIENGIITEIVPLKKGELKTIGEEENGLKVIRLAKTKSALEKEFDVIYPGLIDLHNHPKQNNLPTWSLAKGQFANRFEWSDWSEYKNAVSSNMNPWVGYHPIMSCATFRWSELQAMILGTTYMQGFVSDGCVSNFSIHRAEDGRAYRYPVEADREAPVSAPTFLMDPTDYIFVWNDVRPEMLKLAKIEESEAATIKEKSDNIEKALAAGVSYGDGAFRVIKKYCPSLVEAHSLTEVVSKESIKIVSNRTNLESQCLEDRPAKLVRFMTFHHGGVISRQGSFQGLKAPRVVAHLSEGRSDDPYNQIEFPMLRLLGFAKPGVNLVHAVGVSKVDLDFMAKNQMGVVWSPYSNLILYSQTLNLENVKAVNSANKTQPLLLALGSDWVPTGSKSVLEEVKLARRYVHLKGLQETFTDYELFKMMTENPARMIGHFHDGDGKENGIGTIAVGANATLIALNRKSANPFNNIVEKAGEGDVNLVVVDGNPIYGEVNYLNQAGFEQNMIEILPNYMPDLAAYKYSGERSETVQKQVGTLLSELETADTATKTEIMTKLSEKLGEMIASESLEVKNDSSRCDFTKGFVHQEIIFGDESMTEGVIDYQLVTGGRTKGLNISRVSDLQKVLGIHLMSQSDNSLNGRVEKMPSYFPSLFSCNDLNPTIPHLDRIQNFIPDPNSEKIGEYQQNLSEREKLRSDYLKGKPSGADKMKEAYGL